VTSSDDVRVPVRWPPLPHRILHAATVR
jgi:hypothetical protein